MQKSLAWGYVTLGRGTNYLDLDLNDQKAFLLTVILAHT